jgi:BirA family biotin operon repressor/biotin-[acetyl-CoA-carboxylase] ligase
MIPSGGINFICVMLFRDKAIIQLETVDSTNNYAANLIKLSQPPEGTVITAQMQTLGKGQRNATWQSDEGQNLLCSVILYPKFLYSANQFSLIQAMALGLQEMLEKQLEMDVYVKWPNDLIVQDKKIAGILIESSWTENRMHSAVVGIGLNLNQMDFESPKAISMKKISGKSWDAENCLIQLMDAIEKYYLKLHAGAFKEISAQYMHHLYRIHQNAQFIFEDKIIEATIIGVDIHGRLKLQTVDSRMMTCNLKEIALIY